jgi:hypothetical protein
MRRSCLGIVGIVFAAALAGCSDTGVQEGAVPFKGTSTDQFNGMKNQTTKHMQSQDYAKQSDADGKAEPGKPAAESKPAGAKPADAPKPADAKPAGDAKPADVPKPASKSG